MDDEKKQTIKLAGSEVTVSQLEIVRRIREEINEYELNDGTIIRVANPTVVVFQLIGQTDSEGNPAIFVKNGTSVTVVRSPKKLN